jgi:hypothetical protein
MVEDLRNITVYIITPLGEMGFSGIWFFRPHGYNPFSERQHNIIRIVMALREPPTSTSGRCRGEPAYLLGTELTPSVLDRTPVVLLHSTQM